MHSTLPSNSPLHRGLRSEKRCNRFRLVLATLLLMAGAFCVASIAWMPTAVAAADQDSNPDHERLQEQLAKLAEKSRVAAAQAHRHTAGATRSTAASSADSQQQPGSAPGVLSSGSQHAQTMMPPAASSFLPPTAAAHPGSSGTGRTPNQGVSTGTSISEDAFASTIRTIMPMTPEQIGTLRLAYDAAQKASAYGVATPPRPVASSRAVDLSPGATPPVVRLSAGYITSLVFLDSTGAPWPIQSYDLGNPRAYNIQWDRKSNTMMVQAITQYKPANLAVLLRGLNTPVMVSLIPAQQALDYRVDMQVPGMGPNAKPNVSALPAHVDSGLLSVLDGIKPAKAKALGVTGGDAQAWLVQDDLYVRTRLSVISPGWVSKVSSADGTHVYLLPKATMLLASDHGKMVQLRLEGL